VYFVLLLTAIHRHGTCGVHVDIFVARLKILSCSDGGYVLSLHMYCPSVTPEDDFSFRRNLCRDLFIKVKYIFFNGALDGMCQYII
jgi:hypothetical protein